MPEPTARALAMVASIFRRFADNPGSAIIGRRRAGVAGPPSGRRNRRRRAGNSPVCAGRSARTGRSEGHDSQSSARTWRHARAAGGPIPHSVVVDHHPVRTGAGRRPVAPGCGRRCQSPVSPTTPAPGGRSSQSASPAAARTAASSPRRASSSAPSRSSTQSTSLVLESRATPG